MIVKVNEALPEGERISCYGWRRGVAKQYRRIYPRSKLPLVARICEIALGVSFIATMWLIMGRTQ
jgi:hypothetical protein